MKIKKRVTLSPIAKRILFVVVIFGIFSLLKPAFATYDSILSIIQGIAFVGISSVFLTLLITAGEFDISIGATTALSAIVAGMLTTHLHVNFFLSVLASLLVGMLIGFINAMVVIYGNVPSFIASIAMLFIGRSLATYISQAKAIENFPEPWHGFKESLFGRYFAIVIFILIVLIGEFLLNRTNFGKVVAAIGSNKEAARISGINVKRVKIILFILTGLGAALAGVIADIHFSSSRAGLGTGWELFAIAGLVIGGTSLFGGRGTVIGLLLGLLLMQIIASGMVVANIDPWWQTVITGVIVLVSLGIDKKRKKVFADG